MATFILRALKRSLGLALACAAITSASAYSVFGPAESWQVTTLDYLTRWWYPFPGGNSTEVGGPKNFGEGSRINTPIVTYGFDISFLEYFGAKGVAAVDSAMATLNALPASSSANPAAFLMQGNQQINYTAQALELTDVKSFVLSLMLEHMGLNGETHVWDLHARNSLPSPPACEFEYVVIPRNYDPATSGYSSVVNGVDYNYEIQDACPIGVQVADAFEFPLDEANPAEVTYTAVSTLYGQQPGGYYLGLTYDDMGGLRYLYNKNNWAWEVLDPNAVVSSFGTGSWEGVSSTNAGGIVGNGGAVSNFAGFLGGVEKITYVRMPTDTILGGFAFTPLKFSYTIPGINEQGGLTSVHITRTVFTPDIVFSAADMVGNTLGAAPFTYSASARGFGFINPGAVAAAGTTLPEVISPQETVTFNNVTPFYVNETPVFLDGTSFLEYPGLLWGSFDGTTNPPTVYPETSTTSELEEELFGGASGSGSESTTWIGLTLETNASATGAGQ
jgi:hypothetical protein